MTPKLGLKFQVITYCCPFNAVGIKRLHDDLGVTTAKEVIENGNAPPITKVVKGVETIIASTTAEEKAQRMLKLKARSTLLMGIPNVHQLKFNSIKDAKSLLQAVELSSETLDQTFDRLQKLISQLEIHGESISEEDMNQKFLRSLQPNSSQLDNEDLQQINLDDLEETNLRWQMAMLTMRARRFLKNTGRKLTVNGNETIGFDKSKNTRRVVPVETTTSNALVSCNGSGYDWSDQAESVEARLLVYKKNKYLYEEDIKVLKHKIHLRELAITELMRKLELAQKQKDEIQLTVENFKNSSKNLSKLIDCQIVDKCKTGLGYNAIPPPYTGNFMPPKPDLSFTGLEEFTSEPIVIKLVAENSEARASEAKPKAVRKNNGALIIEDWVSDNEEDDVPQAKIEKKTFKPSFAKIEFVKPKQQEKTARKTGNHVEQNRQNIHIPKGNKRNWNNMMFQRLGSNFEMFNKTFYVCGSFDHLQVGCKKVNQKQFQNTKPVWNNAKRVNHQNFAKKTHPCPKKNMVPRAVLMKSGLVSVNTARQVNTAHPKVIINSVRPMTNLSKSAHSTVRRPINNKTTFKNSNFNQRDNTVKDKKFNTARPKEVVNAARPKAVVNVVKGNNVNVVKASACWVWKPKTKIQVSDGLVPQKKLILLSNVQGNLQMDLQDQGCPNCAGGGTKSGEGRAGEATNLAERNGALLWEGGIKEFFCMWEERIVYGGLVNESGEVVADTDKQCISLVVLVGFFEAVSEARIRVRGHEGMLDLVTGAGGMREYGGMAGVLIVAVIDPHSFNAESNLIESLLNRDTLIDSSPKFDYLLEEFSGELAHINPIPPVIEKADFDLEKEIHLVKNLLYDNSSPRPPERT
ncbi:hypothetical protein Tco_1505807 [Tanacetum coccineum]